MVLKIRKRVKIVVLASSPEDFDAGRTKLTNFYTIRPNKKLVKLEAIITAYCIV